MSDSPRVKEIRLRFNCFTGAHDRFSRQEVRDLLGAIDDLQNVADDHRRLVRQLDIVLNGEAGAAEQASLIDIVAQLRGERRRRRESEPSRAAWERLVEYAHKHSADADGCREINEITTHYVAMRQQRDRAMEGLVRLQCMVQAQIKEILP